MIFLSFAPNYRVWSQGLSGILNRLLLSTLLLVGSYTGSQALTAHTYFEYSPQAREAYELIFSLRFQEARESLVRLRITEPDNLIVHSLYNYLDCLGIFIGEQSETYEKLRHQKQLRLNEIRDHGDRQSPYYLYTQADIHLQWAITRVKFEDYFAAVMEIKRAFNLLTRNEALFPNFMPNKKNLGLLHALVGTVPDQYRWAPRLLGMDGTIAQGMAEIEEVLIHAENEDFVFRDEVYVMYAYLLLHLENQGEKAWALIDAAPIDPTQNPLACFVKANVAMKTGRNDLAIKVLEDKPEGPAYFPFAYLHFMEGVAKLQTLDPDADQPLMRFLQQTRGMHYIKEAYQKLAWHELIHQRPHRYQRYMEACARLGAAVVEEDKTAQYEARIRHVPEPNLLTARVLFDGGYYLRAIRYLEKMDQRLLSETKWQLEYHYRLGRLKHANKDLSEALIYYQKTVDLGEFEGFYFACNAALMMGRIYEKQGNVEKAKEAYQRTLSIKPDQYQSSLHQKAKAGLNRLTEMQ